MIGNNDLSGTIPEFIKDNKPANSDPSENCASFLNIFSVFISKIWRQEEETSSESNLETLSLCKYWIWLAWFYSFFSYGIQYVIDYFLLDGNRLTGHISSSIFQIPNLKTLNLGEAVCPLRNEIWCFYVPHGYLFDYCIGLNLLDGELPSEIGLASQLRVFDISEYLIFVWWLSINVYVLIHVLIIALFHSHK